jgi:hypothetical protein
MRLSAMNLEVAIDPVRSSVTVGGLMRSRANITSQSEHIQMMGVCVESLNAMARSVGMEVVSHRPDFGATPVDFKLHHYPAL